MNAAFLSTRSSSPKFPHLRNSHSGGNNFRSKAANARFQFRSVSQILNVILGQRLNHSVGRLFTKRNFTVLMHHYLFSGIIIFPLPRINCFSQSILRAWSKCLTGSIRLLLRLQYPSRHYFLNVRRILNFLPLILGASAKHQIEVTYAAL